MKAPVRSSVTMTEVLRRIPYPVLAFVGAFVAGRFLSHLAAHRGLSIVGRALVVGVGVLVLAGVVAMLVGPRTQRRWQFMLSTVVGAIVGSLLADVFG